MNLSDLQLPVWEMEKMRSLAEETAEAASLKLLQKEEGLCLSDGRMEVYADLKGNLRRLQAGNLQRELLVRAAKGKKEGLALDATAGLGEDSLLLAAAGLHVVMYEANPVIALLLWDALSRAGLDPELRDVTGRMRLVFGDSIEAMRSLPFRPDLILLDPMFPERRKSGMVKKKFQLLQRLEQPCAEEEELLDAAVMAGPEKVIIKRPYKGPFLAGRKPTYSIGGKTIRYDCIVLPRAAVPDPP